jgi:hypothetical protein
LKFQIIYVEKGFEQLYIIMKTEIFKIPKKVPQDYIKDVQESMKCMKYHVDERGGRY